MINEEEIEQKLWDYIDGNCNKTDQDAVLAFIENDVVWKQKYYELLDLQKQIADSFELQQPSMRFNKNVMEAISTIKIAQPTNKYINTYIVKGIVIFYIALLVCLLGYSFINADWSEKSVSLFSQFKIDKQNYIYSSILKYIDSGKLNIFICINVLLGLVFIDAAFRKNNKFKIMD